ncbi:MAG TPA: hypothetical protein VHE59_01435 [Mucilaginibacter sp.]|nr:hypothetical protein [Mucilaginibacter sp.]
MKQQEVFKRIGNILKELNEQYEYLEGSEHELNDLELELFVANAHFLADHSNVLRKLNQQNVQPPPIAEKPKAEIAEDEKLKEEKPKEEEKPKKEEKPKEEKYFEPVVQQLKPEPEAEATPVNDNQVEDKPVPHIDLAANGADDDFSVMRNDEPMIIRHELELDEADIIDDEDDTGFDLEEPPAQHVEKPMEIPHVKYHAPIKEEEREPELKKEPVHAEPKKEPSHSEQKKEHKHEEVRTEPSEEKPMTINQRMSAQLHKTQSYSDHAHGQPVTDLKQAINLNDKLLYIKDLFNGYNLAYAEAIDLVNRLNSFEEADKFLKSNYAAKNNWESKPATTEKFYALLRRRFPEV